jgi:PAS domain S-box-containing protein
LSIDELRHLTNVILEKDELIHRERDRFESTFNSISDCIIIVNDDLIIQDVNTKTLNLLKLDKSEILNKKYNNFFSYTTGLPYNKLKFCKLSKTFEHYDKSRDIWWMVTISPIIENEDLIGYVHILKDINAQKLTQQALEDKTFDLLAYNQELTATIEELQDRNNELTNIEGFIDNLFTNFPIPICYTDLNNNILKSNKLFNQLNYNNSILTNENTTQFIKYNGSKTPIGIVYCIVKGENNEIINGNNDAAEISVNKNNEVNNSSSNNPINSVLRDACIENETLKRDGGRV